MSTLYHNPRCSKSREALALLQSAGIEPAIVLYLETPPTSAQLRKLIKQLRITPRELLRKSEADYKDAGLSDLTLSDSHLIEAMCAHPKLIERPIFVHADRAIVGRPPERVLQLLETPNV